jgi:hypothetical protein
MRVVPSACSRSNVLVMTFQLNTINVVIFLKTLGGAIGSVSKHFFYTSCGIVLCAILIEALKIQRQKRLQLRFVCCVDSLEEVYNCTMKFQIVNSSKLISFA